MPRKYPRDNISENFMAAKQTGSSLREKKGTESELAELENSKCQGNTPENFMAAEQTGSSLREERVLDGHLRNWNRRTKWQKEVDSREGCRGT